MAERTANRPGVYDAPGETAPATAGAKKSVNVYDAPAKSAFPKNIVWLLVLLVLVALVIMFLI
jgi:hypothetical protein